jgi:hypothetical protein
MLFAELKNHKSRERSCKVREWRIKFFSLFSTTKLLMINVCCILLKILLEDDANVDEEDDEIAILDDD